MARRHVSSLKSRTAWERSPNHFLGGSFHPRLNIDESPIEHKYREGKMQRTLKKESKVLEIAERETIETSFSCPRSILLAFLLRRLGGGGSNKEPHTPSAVAVPRAGEFAACLRQVSVFLCGRGTPSRINQQMAVFLLGLKLNEAVLPGVFFGGLPRTEISKNKKMCKSFLIRSPCL